MSEDYGKVKTVIQVLNDGHKGFADIGEHVKDPKIKSFCLDESVVRQRFASEIEEAAGISSDVGGTASGAVHRT